MIPGFLAPPAGFGAAGAAAAGFGAATAFGGGAAATGAGLGDGAGAGAAVGAGTAAGGAVVVSGDAVVVIAVAAGWSVAVGVGAAEKLRLLGTLTGTTVTLATAHPAKFPDAVERATGVRPPLPPHLADLFDLPEHLTVLPNDLAAVQHFVATAFR